MACLICSAVTLLSASPSLRADDIPSVNVTDTLRNVGRRIEQWYARAQTIVSDEAVWIQPLRADMTPDLFPRRLAFELRVGWNPDELGPVGIPAVNVLRQLLSVNGRAPSPERPDRDPGCMDPKPVSPEPLAMLLPTRLSESEFSVAGSTRVNGRAALMIDYRGVATLPPDIAWTDDCVTVSLPGRSRGRVWVDTETYDVLRIDDRLARQFEFEVPRQHVRRGAARSMVIERAESSIRYARIQFDEPRESIMLPVSIDIVTVIRSTSMQRMRITHRLTNHRRFLTQGRLLD